MGGLFYTGQSRRTSGSFTVTCSGAEDIVKRLNKLENGGQTAIKKTVNDFMSRAPAWVSKGIREHYGVDTAAINEAKQQPRRGQSSIQVAGVQVDSASLIYKGRVLTPTHFKMKPTQRKPKPYRVSQEVFKGQRKNLPAGVFLASSGGEGSTQIPFQRESESRYPIKSIKTLSVPQMIENEKVQPLIQQNIDEGLSKRLENHVKQMLAKAQG